MAQRIRGSECSLNIVRNNALEAEFTDIQNFNVTFQVEMIQQGYVGETTDRYDEVFKGCKLDFEMHCHSSDFLVFTQALEDRARRKTPNIVINAVATLFFANGQTPTVTFMDLYFGEVPINIPGKAEYVKVKLSAGCGETKIQT